MGDSTNTEHGKRMGRAIRAVLDMQDDCIRLFHDLDKHLVAYESLWGNVVTLGLGASIAARQYVADGLFRLYFQNGNKDQVLGINICFYNYNDPRFLEPIFVVANTRYQNAAPDPQEKSKKAWDPWHAFLDWSPERAYNVATTIEKPTRRSSVDRITVAAAPLFAIGSLNDAVDLISLVED